MKKLGGTPASKPKDEVPARGSASILDLAATVENLGASAYLGQAANIKSKEMLAAALSIHSVEARHAAALNAAIKKNVSPDGAFAKPASADEVLKQVKPFIVSLGGPHGPEGATHEQQQIAISAARCWPP